MANFFINIFSCAPIKRSTKNIDADKNARNSPLKNKNASISPLSALSATLKAQQKNRAHKKNRL